MVDIPRGLFMETLKNSVNLSYVLEIKGFAKSKSSTVNLFEVMKRLDVFDIVQLLKAVDKKEEADTVAEYYISGDCGWDGFDCYLEWDQKRDYIIKQILKGVRPPHPYGENFVDSKQELTDKLHLSLFPHHSYVRS